MEVEYELTLDDLYAFQWRAVYASPRSRRSTRKVIPKGAFRDMQETEDFYQLSKTSKEAAT
jgi:hypothetical protein